MSVTRLPTATWPRIGVAVVGERAREPAGPPDLGRELVAERAVLRVLPAQDLGPEEAQLPPHALEIVAQARVDERDASGRPRRGSGSPDRPGGRFASRATARRFRSGFDAVGDDRQPPRQVADRRGGAATSAGPARRSTRRSDSRLSSFELADPLEDRRVVVAFEGEEAGSAQSGRAARGAATRSPRTPELPRGRRSDAVPPRLVDLDRRRGAGPRCGSCSQNRAGCIDRGLDPIVEAGRRPDDLGQTGRRPGLADLCRRPSGRRGDVPDHGIDPIAVAPASSSRFRTRQTADPAPSG